MTQPDANDQMLAITEQVGIMLAAGKVANWKLAAHAYRAVIKRLNAFVVYRQPTKPLQAQLAQEFIERWCSSVLEAIKAEDIGAFDSACAQLILQANEAHEAAGFGYIVLAGTIKHPAWMPGQT